MYTGDVQPMARESWEGRWGQARPRHHLPGRGLPNRSEREGRGGAGRARPQEPPITEMHAWGVSGRKGHEGKDWRLRIQSFLQATLGKINTHMNRTSGSFQLQEAGSLGDEQTFPTDSCP